MSQESAPSSAESDLVPWRVGYKYRTCLGSAMMPVLETEVVIMAPPDREAAKLVVVAYLDGLNNRAQGQYMLRDEKTEGGSDV